MSLLEDQDRATLNQHKPSTPSTGANTMKRKVSEVAGSMSRCVLEKLDLRHDSLNSPTGESLLCADDDEDSNPLLKPTETTTPEAVEDTAAETEDDLTSNRQSMEPLESAKPKDTPTKKRSRAERDEELALRHEALTQLLEQERKFSELSTALCNAQQRGEFSAKKREGLFSEKKRHRSASDKKRERDAEKLRAKVEEDKKKSDKEFRKAMKKLGQEFEKAMKPKSKWFSWGKGKAGDERRSSESMLGWAEDPRNLRHSVPRRTGDDITVGVAEVLEEAGEAVQRCRTVC